MAIWRKWTVHKRCTNDAQSLHIAGAALALILIEDALIIAFARAWVAPTRRNRFVNNPGKGSHTGPPVLFWGQWQFKPRETAAMKRPSS